MYNNFLSVEVTLDDGEEEEGGDEGNESGTAGAGSQSNAQSLCEADNLVDDPDEDYLPGITLAGHVDAEDHDVEKVE
tara:strand:- start:291 stop:521 length:231 start_codon:yes stop_codon:yes gene_type:complete